MQRFINFIQCTALECGGCSAPPKTVCGIGAVLQPNEHGELEVVDLVPGGAAETSGLLQVGDVVHEVDGVDMYKLPAKEVGEFIRGEVGTKISLGVAKKRCNSGTVYIETVELVRSEAKLPEKRTHTKLAWENSSGSEKARLLSHKSSSFSMNSVNNINLCDAAGIGAVLSKNQDQDLEFTELLEGGAAESSGMIDIGDILTEVDGVNIEKKALSEVGNMIRGDAGTTVCLAIAKDGDREVMMFPVIIRDCAKVNELVQKKNRVTNVAAKAAKAAYVSFDPLDMTLCEPDLKHRPSQICPISTEPSPNFIHSSTSICVTLSPR